VLSNEEIENIGHESIDLLCRLLTSEMIDSLYIGERIS